MHPPLVHDVIVVAAVVEENDRFLLTRRLEGVHLAGLWEFPGGKVDGDESHADALEREIREELGATIEVGELILQTTYDYPDRSMALFFYRCRLLEPPSPLLGQEMRWVPRTGLRSLGLPPADEELITRLQAAAGT